MVESVPCDAPTLSFVYSLGVSRLTHHLTPERRQWETPWLEIMKRNIFHPPYSSPGLFLLHWLRGLPGPMELRFELNFLLSVVDCLLRLLLSRDGGESRQCVLLWLRRPEILLHQGNSLLSKYFTNISTPGGPEDLREGREVHQHSHPGLGLILHHHTRRYNNLRQVTIKIWPMGRVGFH